MSGAAPPARAVPGRLWTWPAYGVLAAGLLLQLVAPAAVHAGRYVPLVASFLVLGMPHGAVDHRLSAWVGEVPADGRRTAGFLAGYVAAAAAGVALWLIAPVGGLVLFLAVAVVHWGEAELAWFTDSPRTACFAAARGLVPVVLPALVHPRAYDAAVRALLGPFTAHAPALAPHGAARAAALAAVVGICLAGAGRGRRAPLELLALAVFFTAVDPVFAVGLYFIAWHSWRHVLRLAALHPRARAALRGGRPGQAVAVVLRAAAPCTAVALAGTAALVALLAADPASAPQLTAVGLAWIAALTTPHAVVVARLDAASPWHPLATDDAERRFAYAGARESSARRSRPALRRPRPRRRRVRILGHERQ